MCIPEWWLTLRPWLWSQIPHPFKPGLDPARFQPAHPSQFCSRCGQ